eukprot:scaffold1053_cov332-Pavlova_lutheri.AAC.11
MSALDVNPRHQTLSPPIILAHHVSQATTHISQRYESSNWDKQSSIHGLDAPQAPIVIFR